MLDTSCFKTDELKTARDEWFDDQEDAEDEYGPIGEWKFCDGTSFSKLFEERDRFNEDISGWDVGGVTSMSDMFDKADLFNQDLSGWNVKNVLNMHRMFSDASFNQNLSEWDVS
uniref:BspA family leucine-rich repeat surface protein n=2 Tax=Corethron hystrix TaxID=216773 RepID=A0A7S1FWX5_9STRA|mmetsp:Transcript_38657/g.89819  ORF Transcript_38657/g.89819 Transcript_38657/m.89819 type:complete len:114 (+) Transcript_38657:94-435(+)